MKIPEEVVTGHNEIVGLPLKFTLNLSTLS